MPPGDRLPRHRVRLARVRRADAGPAPGAARSTPGVGDDHRAVRRLGRVARRCSSFVERRAVDPILPLRLFRSSVFSVSVVLAFIVGFAMLGAMTFLPTYLQYVQGRLGHQLRPADAAAGARPAGHLDRGRHDRRPHRPLQDLPGRRLARDGGRAVPAVAAGRRTRRTGRWPWTCSCSASASACACRC